MGSRRYALSDFEWSIIGPLLPNKPRGVPRVEDRRVLKGIYRRLPTGLPMLLKITPGQANDERSAIACNLTRTRAQVA